MIKDKIKKEKLTDYDYFILNKELSFDLHLGILNLMFCGLYKVIMLLFRAKIWECDFQEISD